jgi:hypothetical protein
MKRRLITWGPVHRCWKKGCEMSVWDAAAGREGPSVEGPARCKGTQLDVSTILASCVYCLERRGGGSGKKRASAGG